MGELMSLPDKQFYDPFANITPYSFNPVSLLREEVEIKLAEAENTAKYIYNEIVKQAPELIQMNQATKEKYKLIVDVSQKTLRDIEAGKIKLTNENGNTYAQLFVNGRYSKKLPVKMEHYTKNFDPMQMANALQMKALQEQMEEISNQLSFIDQHVKSIIQGQYNDRIGLHYSGIALYLEARNVSDAEMKKALISQALKGLTDATFQLVFSMKSDIEYLKNEEYNSIKGKRAEAIKEKMDSINQSFAVIHQSSLLRAAIYCNEGELSAMSSVLNEYSQFLKNTVKANSSLLKQCDTADKGTVDGPWSKRVNLKLDVAEINKQLCTPNKEIFIEVVREADYAKVEN